MNWCVASSQRAKSPQSEEFIYKKKVGACILKNIKIKRCVALSHRAKCPQSEVYPYVRTRKKIYGYGEEEMILLCCIKSQQKVSAIWDTYMWKRGKRCYICMCGKYMNEVMCCITSKNKSLWHEVYTYEGGKKRCIEEKENGVCVWRKKKRICCVASNLRENSPWHKICNTSHVAENFST